MKSTSPKTKIRKSVLAHYRARGKRINNLWLIYSPKTDSDWILPSDRELIHWLAFLETNPDVKTFTLQPDLIISHDNEDYKGTIFDAVVTLNSGATEYHEVKSGTDREPKEGDRSQLAAQLNAARKDNITYKRYNDVDLKPQAKFAMRWLAAISYAAAIRDQDHKHFKSALSAVLHEKQKGNIREILKTLESYDQAIILGLIVKSAINGLIHLDLSKNYLGYASSWSLKKGMS
jgi:hypothetical protein